MGIISKTIVHLEGNETVMVFSFLCFVLILRVQSKAWNQPGAASCSCSTLVCFLKREQGITMLFSFLWKTLDIFPIALIPELTFPLGFVGGNQLYWMP